METNLRLPETSEQQRNTKELLEERWAEGKFLCVGLDVTSAEDTDINLWDKSRIIVDATKDIAAAYKPNSAFYEENGRHGFERLQRLIEYIEEQAPGVPVIWDAKRADIANTNNGYKDARDLLRADSLTIHPYLGGTAVEPLLNDPNKAGFVLVHTSNPGADEFQHLQLQTGEQLWERVAHNVAHSPSWNHGATLGVVTGATYPKELAKARHIIGDEVVMLIPGIGTQGGDQEAAVRGAMNSRGNGFLINVSSGISKAKDANDQITPESIREAALKYHHDIQLIWKLEQANPSLSYEDQQRLEIHEKIGRALLMGNCLLFGEFTLRSGAKSPVYVDIRSAITDPSVRNEISQTYVGLVRDLEEQQDEQFDVLGGIPQAATSFASIVADRMGRRLVQPRAGVKEYGGKKLVEGEFKVGETIGLIDDLITDGGAKVDTINQVKAAGLEVGGVAVLLDREQGGAKTLAEHNVPMIAATTLRKVILALSESGKISDDLRRKVIDYLNK